MPRWTTIQIGALLALMAADAKSQTREEIQALFERSFPAGRPVALDHRISANLDGVSFHGLECQGTLEGRDRLFLALHSSTWEPERRTLFLARGSRVAFKEEGLPKGEPKWKTYRADDAEDPAYSVLLFPDEALARVVSRIGACEPIGERAVGPYLCRGYQSNLAPEAARNMMEELGLVVEQGDKVESTSGKITLWIVEAESILQGLEIELLATVKQPQAVDPSNQGGSFSWDGDTGGDLGGRSLQIPIKPPGGSDAPVASGGAGTDRKVRDPRRQYLVSLAFDYVVDDKPPPAIEPDPEAARLVDW